jgi:uracil-DNA glycosylase
MVWSERQVSLLGAMGIRVWQPEVELATPRHSRESENPSLHHKPADALPVPTDSSFRGNDVAPAQALPPTTPTSASSIQSMPWPALRSAVNNCRACPLCEERKQSVFGVGHDRAHWLIVGEAPGEQEDREGEPFVGKSGQLLNNMLHALGLTRHTAGPEQQVYIANTVKCRPPSNRNPQPDELAQCEPYLMRQIALVQPRVILAMGRFAVQSLLRSTEPIGRLRGKVHTYQNVPLIVTYHPAYLLRNPEDKARAWQDLCLAREQIIGS